MKRKIFIKNLIEVHQVGEEEKGIQPKVEQNLMGQALTLVGLKIPTLDFTSI